jgi:cysteine synthase A
MAHVDTAIAEALALPRILQLAPNLYAAVFSLMKLLPARYMLARARASGALRPSGTVIETSSGTFALGLAMVCHQTGHRLIIVGDPAIDAPLARRLSELGADLEIVREPAREGGFQRARLDRVAALCAAHRDSYYPAQYANPDNPRAYAALAQQLCDAVGRIDVLVGAVGSGGSMCGTSRFLRAVHPRLRAIGIDTHGSMLFGQPDAGGKRLLRGLGNSLLPANLDHTTFDEVHWVSGAAGFRATRELHRRHALYMGPTSGASFLAARWHAARHPDENVVVLCADEGHRYQDTVYDDAWLRDKDAWTAALPDAPCTVLHPHDAASAWDRIAWGRRSLGDVTAAAAMPQAAVA